jgi:hypothetical protein
MSAEKPSPQALRQFLIEKASDLIAQSSIDPLNPNLSRKDVKKVRKQLKLARQTLKVASKLFPESPQILEHTDSNPLEVIELETIDVLTPKIPDFADPLITAESQIETAQPELPEIIFQEITSIDGGKPPRKEKKPISLGDRQKTIGRALLERNDDGTLKYSHSGDQELVREIYADSIIGLQGIKLQRKIISIVGSTLTSSKATAKRFDDLLNGKNDPEAQSFFNELQLLHPDLTLEEAIKLLTRKGVSRRGRTRKNQSTDTKTARKDSTYAIGNSPLFARTDHAIPADTPAPVVIRKITVLPDAIPKISSGIRKGPYFHIGRHPRIAVSQDTLKPVTTEINDVNSIPIPELPTKLKTRQEKLVYSLMLINNSRTRYAYKKVESAVPDIYNDVLVKIPPEMQAESLRDFTADAIKSVRDFIEGLRSYKVEDIDFHSQKNISKSVVDFISWADSQPIYAAYTTEELIKILQREIPCSQIIETYQEYIQTELAAKRKPIKVKIPHSTSR